MPESPADDKPNFPSLPIVTPDVNRRGLRERYGLLYYLALIGLCLLTTLILNFGYGVWVLRDVWTDVSTLYDPGRPEVARIEAARRIAATPSLTDPQRWEFLRGWLGNLPKPARFVLAEGLTADVLANDVGGYANTVATSDSLPDWLRLLLMRPMALAASDRIAIPRAPLDTLLGWNDVDIRLWAAYSIALMRDGDPKALGDLVTAASKPGPGHELAKRLLAAARAQPKDRLRLLNEAAAWQRAHRADFDEIWKDWKIVDGHVTHIEPTKPESATKK